MARHSGGRGWYGKIAGAALGVMMLATGASVWTAQAGATDEPTPKPSAPSSKPKPVEETIVHASDAGKRGVNITIGGKDRKSRDRGDNDSPRGLRDTARATQNQGSPGAVPRSRTLAAAARLKPVDSSPSPATTRSSASVTSSGACRATYSRTAAL